MTDGLTGHRWEGYSHQELWNFAHAGPGSGASQIAVEHWGGLGTAIRAIDIRLSSAIGAAGAGWEGEAASATTAAVTPLGTWAIGAAEHSWQLYQALDTQATDAAHVRAQMPPVQQASLPEEPPPLRNAPGLVPADVRDWSELDAQRDEATQRARDLMRQYGERSLGSVPPLPTWEAPPAVVVASGSAGTPAAPVGEAGGGGSGALGAAALGAAGLGAAGAGVVGPGAVGAGGGAPAGAGGVGPAGAGSNGAGPGGVVPGGIAPGATGPGGTRPNGGTPGAAGPGGIGPSGIGPGGTGTGGTGSRGTGPGGTGPGVGSGGVPGGAGPGGVGTGPGGRGPTPALGTGGAPRPGTGPGGGALPPGGAPTGLRPDGLPGRTPGLFTGVPLDEQRGGGIPPGGRGGGPLRVFDPTEPLSSPSRGGVAAERPFPTVGGAGPRAGDAAHPLPFAGAGAGGAGSGRERRRPDYLVEDADVFADDRWICPPVIGGDDHPWEDSRA